MKSIGAAKARRPGAGDKPNHSITSNLGHIRREITDTNDAGILPVEIRHEDSAPAALEQIQRPPSRECRLRALVETP